MSKITRSQGGDTIVEVLISLAVLGLIIAGSFSIVNSALRNSRQAQERAEATKLAESQVEIIKTNPENVPAATPFCFSATGTVATLTGVPPDFTTDDYSVYPAACKGRNTSGLYNVFITRQDARYTINVRWDRIGGGKEQTVMVYRGYE